jgi:iron complex transport system ATP-binding protein
MNPTLHIESIGFAYRKKPVLHDISFHVEKGAICGLLGPNASGKTTLLKCINGILKASEGGVRVMGKTIQTMTRQEIACRMAVVPQQTSTVFPFTALQMVVMGRAARLNNFSLPSKKDRSEAEKSLDELNILELGPRPFGELSGGERQLVLLSRALYQDTPILLLDEPTAHLDFKNQYMIMDSVLEITRKKGLSTLISLHDPNLAARYADHLVMLKGGSLLHDGTCDAVFNSHILSQVYGIDVTVERTEKGATIVLPFSSCTTRTPPVC